LFLWCKISTGGSTMKVGRSPKLWLWILRLSELPSPQFKLLGCLSSCMMQKWMQTIWTKDMWLKLPSTDYWGISMLCKTSGGNNISNNHWKRWKGGSFFYVFKYYFLFFIHFFRIKFFCQWCNHPQEYVAKLNWLQAKYDFLKIQKSFYIFCHLLEEPCVEEV
jgi:hypothetical protein